MSDKYNFSFEPISVYASALKLIKQFSDHGCIHIDLGCGYAAISNEIKESGIRYIGFDSDVDVVNQLQMRGIEAYIIDLRDSASTIDKIRSVCLGFTSLTVSMLDVIEHLDYEINLVKFLSKMSSDFNRMHLILSVPNFAHIDVSEKLFAGQWEYTETGLLDHTHKVIYTERNLSMALRNAGWVEVGEADYRLEYSDQFFMRPSIILNREIGIGRLLRKIKNVLDGRCADVHQFVRAYSPINMDNSAQSQNVKSNNVLISIFVNCDFCLNEFIKISDVIGCYENECDFEFIVCEDNIKDYDCLKLTEFKSSSINLIVVKNNFDPQSIFNTIHGLYWMLIDDLNSLCIDFFDQICFFKNRLTGASIVLIDRLEGAQIGSFEQCQDLNPESIGLLPAKPNANLLIPKDYCHQFRDYPNYLWTEFEWAQYTYRVAVRSGIKKISINVSGLLGENGQSVKNKLLKDFNQFNLISYVGAMGLDDPFICKSLLTQLAEIEQLNQEINSLKNSSSWRLTAPIRRFMGLVPISLNYWLSLNWLERKAWGCLYNRLSHKVPIFGYLRKIYIKVNLNIRGACNSSTNILSLQALSARRSIYTNSNINLEKYEWPEIDISIVAFNSARWIKPFFLSLEQQSYPLNKINLVIVDHGSTDGTVALFDEIINSNIDRFLSIKLIHQENFGFGAGHARAISEGNSEFCLVTNLDIEFEKNAISRVVEYALNDRDGNAASWEFRQIPYEHPKYYDPVTLETNWSSHACVLLRRDAYSKVGGYDSQIFMYGEDVEFSYRLRSYGYSLRYVPSAVVRHFTYEAPTQIKPLQYGGSTIGNIYIRLRYGNWRDRVFGFSMYALLLLKAPVFEGSKKILIKNAISGVKKIPHFLSNRGKSTAYYPFRKFDYEMIRDGAFYEIKPAPCCLQSPLVTIITRTYEGRGFLLVQAIQSVFNQTYPNIELLIVEDGGDSQQPFVSKMADKSPDGCVVHFISNDKLGRSSAGNVGLAAAKGDFVMFLDDDDLLFSDHLETLMSVLNSDTSLSAAYSLAFEVYTRLDINNEEYMEESFHTPDIFRQEWDYEVLKDHNFIPIQSILFNRNLYISRGGFDPNLDQLEDWNLWLRYGYRNKFAYVAKTTSLYRVPAELNVRLDRAKILDAAYVEAKLRADAACADYFVL